MEPGWPPCPPCDRAQFASYFAGIQPLRSVFSQLYPDRWPTSATLAARYSQYPQKRSQRQQNDKLWNSIETHTEVLLQQRSQQVFREQERCPQG
jgi:hypothetical protein